jgi:uncharacterized protein
MEYNIDKLKGAISSYSGNVCLHGGEPLSIPKKDVEELLKASFDKNGKSSVQTNGTLIDDEFIEIFKKYKTSVGISIDGDGELNSFRTNPEKTQKIIDSLFEIKKAGLGASVIIVVSKSNAESDKLDKFKPCTDSSNKYSLDSESLKKVYGDLLLYTTTNGWAWSPFTDIWNSLIGNDNVVCTFKGCDIYHTSSCEEILGDGTVTNCLRISNKDLYLRHPLMYNTRDEILKQVNKKYGGCKDCEFFDNCHGGCPSQAINGDWRNRTELCDLYYDLFSKVRNMQTAFGCSKNMSKVKTCNAGYQDRSNHYDGHVHHIDSDLKGE